MANYREQKDIDHERSYQRYVKRLPEFYGRFCSTAVRSTSKATYAYHAYDFFKFLVDNNPELQREKTIEQSICKLTLDDMTKVNQLDAAEYVRHLQQKYAVTSVNAKINAISTFYLNLYQLGQIEKSPFLKIQRPKTDKKHTIIHMAKEEQEAFFNVINNGTGLTPKELKLQDKTRDLAIFTLFLDTGLRISELVGIDVSDVDFYEHSIVIVRKGRASDNVFMSDKAESRIKEYMEERQRKLNLKSKKENALFLNEKLGRLSVKSIQNLTMRYKTLAGIDKKISPHKLRSTFAMDFIEKIPDLMLLQDAMGHANPATTEVYARASKQRQKAARNFRED